MQERARKRAAKVMPGNGWPEGKQSMDAYKILGLREGAGEDEVKAAYRALAQKYNPENYEAGPLRQDAEAKMDELNQAFDQLMSQLRGGPGVQQAQPAQAEDQPVYEEQNQGPAYQQQAGGDGAAFSQHVRNLITQGRFEDALSALQARPPELRDAEWHFLMGSAYYYKGWLSQALEYFQRACQMAPSNREYAAALHNMQNSANGQMPGNPYGNYGNAQANAVGCNCCDMCTAMLCMDMCCGCGGNGC